MKIIKTYIGKFAKNGKLIPGIWCGEEPENAIISEVRDYIIPEENMILRHKETGILENTVWLKDGDVEENYEETWLEYYNAQVLDLRNQISTLRERITPNDITNENLPPLDSGQ